MIKRRHAHFAFALLGAGLVSVMLIQAWQLQQTDQLSARLAAVPDALDTLDSFNTPGQIDEQPAVQLALGSALSIGGNVEEAERLLNRLISNTDEAEMSIGAQYNLANLYLRQALKSGSATSSQTLPMVELAKQRYRDLLHVMPEHWPARYNLERALQMAPEGTDRAGNERIDPVKSVNVIVPGFEKKDLP